MRTELVAHPETGAARVLVVAKRVGGAGERDAPVSITMPRFAIERMLHVLPRRDDVENFHHDARREPKRGLPAREATPSIIY